MIAHRLTSLALLLVYLLVAGVGQYVDAVLEAEAVAHVAHMEADEDADCAPGHHDVICQLARVTGGAGADVTGSVSLPPQSIRRAVLPPANGPDFETVAAPPVGTRAPPPLL